MKNKETKKNAYDKQLYPVLEPMTGLDKGVEKYVNILREWGVETFESCEGGEGHCFPECTVCFSGESTEGFRALAVVLQHGLPVIELKRVWRIGDNNEPTGPYWYLTFDRNRGQN